MADVQLSIQLTGLQAAQAELSKFGGSFASLSGSLTEASKSIGVFAAKAALIAVPFALAGKTLITAGADFEAAMNKIQVASGATSEQMAQIAEAAKEVGARTTFSAGEAAGALIELAKNGIPVQQALGGVLDAAVDLAAATGTDLAGATDIAAKAMQMFQKPASELPTMMNQLYNATQASTLTLDDMRLALAQGGGAAATAGVSFADFNTTMATIAYNFGSGSDAGTSFKTMLVALAAPTTKQAEEAERLGINIRDASGNFVSMRDLAGQLSTAFAGMGTAQKEESAATLVGTDAMRALIAMADQGIAKFDENAAAVARQGTASAAATVMMKGFWGALDQLSGAIELVGIALVESGFLQFLTDLVIKLSDAIVWVSKLPGPVLNMAAAFTAIIVVLGPIAGVLAGIVAVLGFLLSPIGLAVVAIVGITAALGAGAVAFWTYRDDITAALGAALDAVIAWGDALYQTMVDAITVAVDWAISAMQDMATSIASVFAAIATAVIDWGSTFGSALMDAVQQATAVAISAMQDMASSIAQVFAAVVAAVIDWGDAFGDALVGAVEQAAGAAIGVVKDMATGIVAAVKGLPAKLGGIFTSLKTAVMGPSEQLKDELVGHSVFPDIRDGAVLAFEDMEQAITAISNRLAADASDSLESILQDTTLSLEQQAAAVAVLEQRYATMGDAGAEGLGDIIPVAKHLAKEIKTNNSVIHGVGTALQNNISDWGGWGRSAERIVGAFSQTAKTSLSGFFMTGKFNIADFGTAIKQTFADEAANAVVSFASQGIKAILQWGASMVTGTTMATTGVNTTTTSVWGLNFAMSPLMITVLAIAAVLGILYLAGVDLGDLFGGMMKILVSLGKVLMAVLLVPIKLIASAFQALIGLLETFVGWIKTIGSELGGGDLKDLLDIFGGGLGGGIFKSIGSFFGGLFEEGGRVGGNPNDPVPIVAHGGEFVVNAQASRNFLPLLEALNNGDTPFKAFAAGGDMMLTRPTLLLGGEAGPESVSFSRGGNSGGRSGTVNINGPVIASDLTMGQFARKLGARMEIEQRRKRGR